LLIVAAAIKKNRRVAIVRSDFVGVAVIELSPAVFDVIRRQRWPPVWNKATKVSQHRHQDCDSIKVRLHEFYTILARFIWLLFFLFACWIIVSWPAVYIWPKDC